MPAETADPYGHIHRRTADPDAGLTWKRAGQISGTPAALTAARNGEGLAIWAATDNGIEYSADSGETFSTDLPSDEEATR